MRKCVQVKRITILAKNINEYCVSTVINKNIAIKNKPIAINIFAIKVASLFLFQQLGCISLRNNSTVACGSVCCESESQKKCKMRVWVCSSCSPFAPSLDLCRFVFLT